MEVSLRCHNSPRRNRVTGCGWRHAPEARRGLCENLKKESRRIDFWSSQAPGERASYQSCTRWGPNEQDSKEDCVSPPYVETFNSKLIKRFSTWTRSRYVVLNSEIPMSFICSIVMNIGCPFHPFHPFRTWPYSCIWLCNTRAHLFTQNEMVLFAHSSSVVNY